MQEDDRAVEEPTVTGSEIVPEGTVLVAVTGEDTAVVVGRPSDVVLVGSPVDEVPTTLLKAMTVGNAAMQALFAAGGMSGQLVRLTAESAAALRAFGPMTDTSGAFLGVVRSQNGQFAKVLRFTSVDGVAALAAVGPALAAVALQMQLQQISRQLVQIEQITRRIEQNQEDELTAGVNGDLHTLHEAYELLVRTGVISDTQWSKIAALTGPWAPMPDRRLCASNMSSTTWSGSAGMDLWSGSAGMNRRSVRVTTGSTSCTLSSSAIHCR